MITAKKDLPPNATPPESLGGRGTESPGLPWFASWRSVYLFVIGSFVLYLILLAIFSWTFS